MFNLFPRATEMNNISTLKGWALPALCLSFMSYMLVTVRGKLLPSFWKQFHIVLTSLRADKSKGPKKEKKKMEKKMRRESVSWSGLLTSTYLLLSIQASVSYQNPKARLGESLDLALFFSQLCPY